MSISGKIIRLKSILHLLILKRKNKNADFLYTGDLIDKKCNISCEPNSKCHIGQIWSGAGIVDISTYKNSILQIGNNVCFNSNVRIVCRKKIYIGSESMFGPNVVIIDHDHDYKSCDWKNIYKASEIIIGKNVWIGANVVILRGTVIEDNCIIGAGVVVKGHYYSNRIYYNKQNIVESERT